MENNNLPQGQVPNTPPNANMDTNNSTNNSTNSNLSARQARLATHQKWARRLWYLYLGGLAALVFFFYMLSTQLPSFEELENPESNVASEIYSADGELLGKFYIKNRTPVPYDSLSPHLVKALLATEDARFYEHSGIDAMALGRVFVKTFLMGDRNAGGGSTISQQLAKLLVGRADTRGKNMFSRTWTIGTTKFKEWLTAIKLERSYTKEEILALYFNEFDFLYGAVGIKSAAQIYFGKLPNELTIPEAAMLVRLLQNPSLHNPRRSMERAKIGRGQVLNRMREAGHITAGDYERFNNQPIDISKFKVADHNEGIATYYREHLRDHLGAHLAQLQKEGKIDKKYDLYRDGLKIHTTINARMQRLAEKAVEDHLKDHQVRLFKEWSGWNTENKNTNPWLYQPNGVRADQIQLRLQTLERLISECDRYKFAREEFMPKAVAMDISDPDMLRMKQLERQSEKRDSITASWFRAGYVSQEQITKYNNILRSPEWNTIKKEHDAIIEYMKKPVKMKIFAYNKQGERDTTMSPLDSIKYHRMHLQTGMMSMEPNTGYVRTWVGGINHKYFKYDHVNRRAKRQVGSSIKPFLYALTVDMRGYSSCSQVTDMQTTIHAGEARFGLTRDWTPKNAGGGYSGATMTLTQALTKSLNSISAKLMKDMGSTQPFRNLLGDMSFDTVSIAPSPTICLGAADISVFEMTAGYSIFANAGTYTPPIFIESIEDKNGNIIYMGEIDQEKRQILSEQGAYVMNQMLQAVQRAAGGFAGIKSPHGGKTGTTNFQADGWYMGITPSLVIGTWVGCDDRFIRFKGLANGAGAKMARPIYQNFLRALEKEDDLAFYDYKRQFPKPDIIERELECGNFKGMNFGDEDGPKPADDITNDQYLYDYE